MKQHGFIDIFPCIKGIITHLVQLVYFSSLVVTNKCAAYTFFHSECIFTPIIIDHFYKGMDKKYKYNLLSHYAMNKIERNFSTLCTSFIFSFFFSYIQNCFTTLVDYFNINFDYSLKNTVSQWCHWSDMISQLWF